ncbi:ScbR family autoregulator-binding transcription factor [Rhodococcus rhodochrous]|uniref:TetR family transcriptional regulator n=1 Tax=Rhodococcus rhodochrous KG-21 TaxID=1441923 RepID=A0A0M9WLT3_RHORH|nr:ScbR family autoregulator-binding transcription factor [Rhodococcus rhodochrous]KOS53717.1 TetR family transcriptional regulator [Rhodococcus rhodochrous KG-21]
MGTSQHRGRVTRFRFVTVAAELFAAAGYHGVSTGEIVAAAGSNKGALYYHFRSKDDLVAAIIDEQHHRSIALVQRVTATDAPPLEQIVMLSHALGEQLQESALVRAGLRLSTELDHVPVHPYRDWIGACRALLDRAAADGDLHAGLDLDAVARFVIGAFTGLQQLSGLLTDRRDLPRRIDELWALLLPTLVADPGRRDAVRRARWARPIPVA